MNFFNKNLVCLLKKYFVGFARFIYMSENKRQFETKKIQVNFFFN